MTEKLMTSRVVRGLRKIKLEMGVFADVKATEGRDGRKEADDIRAALAWIESHLTRASGVKASDERQQFEEAMGEALKADQGEYALSRAHQPDQPYTFLATQWAWSAWQRARGVSLVDDEPNGPQSPLEQKEGPA